MRTSRGMHSTSNDSLHIQFSDAVTGPASTTRTMGIGTTSSAEFIIQEGSGASGPDKWGWADNGWDSAGKPIYFGTTGIHTLRMQAREDGPFVDQIVISPTDYLTDSPGGQNNDTTILPETPIGGGGPTCGFTLSAAGVTVAAEAGSGSVDVTVAAGCAWSAASNALWITVSAGSGTGSGTVSFTIAANTSTERTGTLTIAGATYTVSQVAAANPDPGPGEACAVTLDKTSLLVGSAEANWVINVTSDSVCTWTATADSAWLVVKSTFPTAQPVSGTGYVKVRAVANTTGARRVGKFVINGVAYTVTQGG